MIDFRNSLVATIVALSGLLACSTAQARAEFQAEEFDPATHYGKDWTPDDLLKGKRPGSGTAQSTPSVVASGSPKRGHGAEEGLRQWANIGYLDSSGRPLPLAGNWMCDLPRPSNKPGDSALGWDSSYFVELSDFQLSNQAVVPKPAPSFRGLQ